MPTQPYIPHLAPRFISNSDDSPELAYLLTPAHSTTPSLTCLNTACQLEGPGSISLNSLNSGMSGFHVMRSWHKIQDVNSCKGYRIHSSVRFICSLSESTEIIRIQFCRVDSTLNEFCQHNDPFYQCARYSDWLGTARPRGRSSSSGKDLNFLLSTFSRPVLGSTYPYPIGTEGSFSGGKMPGSRSWPITFS
jgi:hypothetical protein